MTSRVAGAGRQRCWTTEPPLDNHLLFRMELEKGIQAGWGIARISLRNKGLLRYDPGQDQYVTVWSVSWSCQVPVTWQDMGRSIRPDQVVGQLDGIDITLTELYLSPMTLRLQLESETPIPQIFGGGTGNRWLQLVNSDNMMLTAKDGRTIPLIENGGLSGDQNQNRLFQLAEITALEDLDGGTLTLQIGDGSVDIPLDDLLPAE